MLFYTAIFAASFLLAPIQATWINVSYNVLCQRVDRPFKYKVILMELDVVGDDVLAESNWKTDDYRRYNSWGWIRGWEDGDWPTQEYEVALRFVSDCAELNHGDTHQYTVQFEICPKLAKQCNYHIPRAFDLRLEDRSTIFDRVYEKIYEAERSIVW